MSYCPQKDVLFEQLTVTEHMNLYCRIRGINKENRKKMIEKLIEKSGLSIHANKKSGQLSGGNKRKVNFAIAMINQPQVFEDLLTMYR